MEAASENSKWLRATIVIAVAAISATTAISIFVFKKKSEDWKSRVQELEKSLKISIEKCVAERKGRIRTQQALRKALSQDDVEKSKHTSYPMTPIAFVESCFNTRNGTPRQPLLVPLARACLVFDSKQVHESGLDGLAEYSHCWILFVFHLNTDLEKIWKKGNSKFKAKVRVPILKGGKMGVFATRSPHRPCPIGLTVAKVEAVQGNMVLLSGVDLVDGTPILDIKPYLPYCDSIQQATVPKWVKADNMLSVASVHFSDEFSSSLANCWVTREQNSLYASPEEVQSLIKQVLSWDIRSMSQRKRPHNTNPRAEIRLADELPSDVENDSDEIVPSHDTDEDLPSSTTGVTYHLMLEGLDISYAIDSDGNVVVEKASLPWETKTQNQNRCNYSVWKDILD